MEENQKLITEYKEACENMKLYVNLRFAHLTIFLATSAALLQTVINSDNETNPPVFWVIRLLGLLSVAVFWSIENSSNDFYFTVKDRAEDIEKKLGFKLHSAKKIKRNAIGCKKWWSNYTSATYGVETMFRAFASMWIFFILVPFDIDIPYLVYILVVIYILTPIFLRTWFEKIIKKYKKNKKKAE